MYEKLALVEWVSIHYGVYSDNKKKPEKQLLSQSMGGFPQKVWRRFRDNLPPDTLMWIMTLGLHMHYTHLFYVR